MATIPLTDEQKDLNKLIKKRYSGFISFTHYDYEGKIPEAKDILGLYKKFLEDNGKIFALYSAIDKYLLEHYGYKHKSMFSELPYTEDILEVRAYTENEMTEFDNNPDGFNQSHPLYKISLSSIKKLFGIEDTLAQKLLHTDYLKITEQQKQNIEEWCQYDKFVARIINYIRKNHPEWEKASKQYKKNLITAMIY